MTIDRRYRKQVARAYQDILGRDPTEKEIEENYDLGLATASEIAQRLRYVYKVKNRIDFASIQSPCGRPLHMEELEARKKAIERQRSKPIQRIKGHVFSGDPVDEVYRWEKIVRQMYRNYLHRDPLDPDNLDLPGFCSYVYEDTRPLLDTENEIGNSQEARSLISFSEMIDSSAETEPIFDAEPGKPKLVSLLISAYKAGKWIEGCVANVLDQELPVDWDIEIIVGIDGCSSTLASAKNIQDPRVKVVWFPENNGTYITYNSIVPYSRGCLLVRHDADDLMGEGRLLIMIEEFQRDRELGLVGTWYTNCDENMVRHPLQSKGRCADGVFMWRRSVWIGVIGGYRGWRCGADTEALERAKYLRIRSKCIKDSDLYFRRIHSNSLTRSPDTYLAHSKGQSERGPERHKSALCLLWLAMKYKKGLETPKRVEPKKVEGIVFGFGSTRTVLDTITVSLASIPGRRDTLEKVVACLLPQVDQLNVYLNNYPDVPEFLSADKITVARSQDHGDHANLSKFFWMDAAQGYYMTCDDDILYPSDYVAKTIEGIERYNRRAIISWHASTLTKDFSNYYRTATPKTHVPSRIVDCFHGFSGEDKAVHVPGSGTLGMHTDLKLLTRDSFSESYLTDVDIGLLAQRASVPIITPKRDKGWIPEGPNDAVSYWTRGRDGEFSETNSYVSDFPWRTTHTTDHVISVIISAWQTEAWVEDAVRSVLAQDLPDGWKIEVLLGTDGCESTKVACEPLYADDRVGIVHFDENRGSPVVFNDLLSICSGELVSRHDADDLMLPGRLSLIIKAFEDQNVDLVNTFWIDGPEGDSRPAKVKGGNSKEFPQPPANGVWTWRREAIERLGAFDDWRVAEDAELLMQADLAEMKREVIPQPLYFRRRHANSIIHQQETCPTSEYMKEKLAELERRKKNKIKRPPFVPKKVRGEFRGRLWEGAVIIDGTKFE
jgi:glycosyltransferase involved in cell wall biosynthesis